MSEHTPGPWIADIDPDCEPSVYDSKGNNIADLSSWGPNGVYREKTINADAILIAAAPDLLEALEDMTARFERCCKYNQSADDEMLSEATKQAYTAIAKARGES